MPIRSINPYIINLFPSNDNGIWWNRRSINEFGKINNMISDMLTNINKMQNMASSIKCGTVIMQEKAGPDHQKYITPSNPMIKNLAKEITYGLFSDDKKMYAIEQWVQKNIKYVTDIENYGQLERWAYPFETIKKGTGDCEDQAYLVHSLGLAAGVNPDRLRTYGGFVFDPGSASPGGHAWNVYKRKMDNKWIAIDTTYYATNIPFNDRIIISEDLRYIDDFWYIQAGQTIETPYANKIRYAKGSVIDLNI